VVGDVGSRCGLEPRYLPKYWTGTPSTTPGEPASRNKARRTEASWMTKGPPLGRSLVGGRWERVGLSGVSLQEEVAGVDAAVLDRDAVRAGHGPW